MKLKIFNLLMILGFVATLMSCDDKWEPRTDKVGTLDLSAMGVDVLETPAGRASSVDVSKFLVTIYSGDTKVDEWTYDAMPEVVTLPVGDYKVNVRSHNVQKAEFSHPYYVGDATFKIDENKITKIGTVECKFASIKVSVVFDAKLKALMEDDCKVTVIANDAGKLVFTRDNEESGFFEAIDGSSTLVASFTGTVDGNFRELTPVTYTDVAAGTHYTITYSLREGSGNIIIDPTTGDPNTSGSVSETTTGGIVINTNIDQGNTITIEGGVEVGGEEDVPFDPGTRPGTENGDPDPGTTPDPGQTSGGISFTSTTLDFDKENPVDVDEAIVVLKSEKGFAHLNVTISSDNADFIASAGELMPLSFDLATITGTDAENLASVGLPVGPYPATQTSIDFNITDLVPLLGAFPGHHAFGLTVIDNEGNSKSLTLKFIAQ